MFQSFIKLSSKKVFVSLALISSFLQIFLSAGLARAASFPDVPENTLYFGAVEFLKAKNIISGYPDGTFQTDKTINRAEALKIVMLGTSSELTSNVTLSFPDVPEEEWFYDFVRKAYELQIVEGYPDGNFKPGNNINVAESLKIIFRAFKVEIPQNVSSDPYPDVNKSEWYAPYANYAKEKQLIWPQDDGKLHADRDITRGEFAEIIYRLLYVQENKLEAFPLSTHWPSYTHPNDHYSLKYPFSWTRLEAGKQTILWKKDEANNQLSFARVYPNSATVVIAVDPNPDRLTLEEYVSLIEYDTPTTMAKQTLNGYPFASVTITERGIIDYYLQLPNHSVAVLYTQLGTGLNKPQLLDEIRYIVGSVRYTEEGGTATVTTKEQFLSNVRKYILVKGDGETVLGLFKDLTLIETDTIGIGTGPVDYYYSSEYDVTLKYERDSKTLLALTEGKDTAF